MFKTSRTLKGHHNNVAEAIHSLPNHEQQKAVLEEMLVKANAEVAATDHHIFSSG